jgi:hypothetical protein
MTDNTELMRDRWRKVWRVSMFTEIGFLHLENLATKVNDDIYENT